MANEKRLIDANASKELILRRSGNMQNDWSSPAVLLAVECQPTVDAVEVVRCKDCKNCDDEGFCWYWKYEPGMRPNTVDADDFCSYGERREGE